MATLSEITNRVQEMQIAQVIERAFTDVQDAFEQENKKQLFAGFNKYGNHLLPYKDRKYALKKSLLNPLPGLGNPDYYVSGKLYSTWQVRVGGNEIRSTVEGPQADKLMARDEGVMGLGGEYKKEF